MDANVSIYERYFDLRVLNADYEEGSSKIPQKKWYDIAIKESLEYFDRQLQNNDRFKDMKIYKLMVKMNQLFKGYINCPQELFNGKTRYENYDVIFDVIAEQIANKKYNSIWPEYDQLIDDFEKYFLTIDDWNDLVYLDFLGQKLSQKDSLVSCVSLNMLIDDINYYNSIRSNPIKEDIRDSKSLIKVISKDIKNLDLDEETSKEVKEYLKEANAYLNIISKMIDKNELKQSKKK